MKGKISIISVVCLVVSICVLTILAQDEEQEIKSLKQIIEGNSVILHNKEGKVIAKKENLYEGGKLIGRVIKDDNENILHKIEYDSNKEAVNPMFLCLDKDGNIIKKAGKPMLVKPFEYEIDIPFGSTIEEKEYDPFGRVSKVIRYIFPCIECEKKTGVKDAVYVW